MERVQAMKNALAKKMLNTELEKLPYSEKELGEGAAVKTMMKETDPVAKKYDNFKNLQKVIEEEKKILEAKLKVASEKKVKAEKKELEARKLAAERADKVRIAKSQLPGPGMTR